MNKCPDKYRGLTPARECRLRSIRLGVEETPGRLPMSVDEKRGKQTLETNTRGQQIMVALRKQTLETNTRGQQIMVALRKRPMRGSEIYKILGVTPQVAHNTLTSLLNDGLIEYSKEGRTRALWALTKTETSDTQGEVI